MSGYVPSSWHLVEWYHDDKALFENYERVAFVVIRRISMFVGRTGRGLSDVSVLFAL